MGHENPLSDFYGRREDLIEEVTQRTVLEAISRSSEGPAPSPRAEQERLITESFEHEAQRLQSIKDPLRDILDKSFWEGVTAEFRSKREDADLRPLLERIVRYHVEEIAGNFDPKVYRMATVMVPNGFNWMLRTLDWKLIWNVFRSLMNEKIDLRRKVHLVGKTAAIQKLARKGTVVLVPTHFSNLDSVLLGWAVYELGLPPFCYGAGLNLFSNPLLGYFMDNLGAYKVDRRKKHSLYRWALLNYSTVALEKNCHSLFFPGGGRSRSGAPEFVSGGIKTGLLSTVLRAYIRNLQNKKPMPNIYIVPCVISYHFVLEASSLIEEHLARSGIPLSKASGDESFMPKVIAKFIYNFLRSSSSAYMNFCAPLDPFGNLVDEEGLSRNNDGRPLSLPGYVATDGEIGTLPQRDREYNAVLAHKILERYKEENFLLTSHFMAYCYFELLLRKKANGAVPELLRTPPQNCDLPVEELIVFSKPILEKLHLLYARNRLVLEPALRSSELPNILDAAARNLGVYHTARPLRLNAERGLVQTDDLKLLYYYRNRMEGYELSRD